MRQRLHARIPRLRRDLAQIPPAVHVPVRHDNLRRHGRRRQNLRQQWVGIKRYRPQHLIQRVVRKRRRRRHPSSAASCAPAGIAAQKKMTAAA